MINDTFLQKEVLSIDRFLHSLVRIKLPVPKVCISDKINDAEEYHKGVITLNPGYLKGKERINISALMAHGYFHHVQHTKFKFYDPSRLWDMLKVYNLKHDEIQEIVDNIFESSAMFFAAAYLTRNEMGNRKVARIVRYLHSKPYTPLAGKFIHGNDMIILLYSNSGNSIRKTMQHFLTYKGQAKTVKDFLEARHLS